MGCSALGKNTISNEHPVCLSKKSLLAERLMLRGALVSVLFSLFRIYLPRSWEEIQIELRLRVQLLAGFRLFILGCKKVILTPAQCLGLTRRRTGML